MVTHSAEEKGKANSPAAECVEPLQTPETAPEDPPAQTHDEAIHLADAPAARAQSSRASRDTAIEKNAARQADASDAEAVAPSALSHDEALRAAVMLVERARASMYRQGATEGPHDASSVQPSDETLRTAAALVARAKLSQHQRDPPGAIAVAPPARAPDAADPAARERLSRPREDSRAGAGATIQEHGPRGQSGAPPALSHDEALRAAIELVARARASQDRQEGPEDPPTAQAAQARDAAVPAARERPTRPRRGKPVRKDAAVQDGAPGVQRPAPPPLSHDEALRAAIELVARAQTSLSQQHGSVARPVTPPTSPPHATEPVPRERASRARAELPRTRQRLPRIQERRTGTRDRPFRAREQLTRARELLLGVQDQLSRVGARLFRPKELLSRTRKDLPGPRLGDIRPSPATNAWSKAQITAAQEIWGEGSVAPGGKDLVVGLFKPLGLKRKMAVLDLGAGLGGPARILAGKFGVRVIGVEWDRGLARAGRALSRKRFWRSRKVSIHALGQAAGGISLQSFDRFIAKDCLFVLPDKARFLRLIGTTLKDHGELMFTDFVLTRPEQPSPAVQAWIAAEPEPPVPWSAIAYVKLFTSLGLNLRIEDMTQRYCSVIRESWAAFDARVEKSELGSGLSTAIADAAELWNRRIEVLEGGDLNYYRFHVTRRR